MFSEGQAMFSQQFKLTILLFILITPITSIISESSYVDNWGVTQVNVKKITYLWTINNYSFVDRENGDMLESPVFSSDKNGEYKWKLRLYPKGYSSSYDRYITLFLTLVSGRNRVKAIYKFSLLSNNNREVNSKSITSNFAKGNVHGYYEFIAQNTVANHENNLLPDDRLTIATEIIMNEGVTNISGGCGTMTSRSQPSISYANNFEKLLENELFSDVVLLVIPYEFQAHKAILAAVSPVFKEILTSNSSVSSISINTEPKIFKEVLRFIYTGWIDNLEKIVKDVWSLANKYQIAQLKEQCEEIMCRSMNETNAIEVLTLADEYGGEKLRKQASNFIAAHALKVVDTPSFKAMEVSMPHPILGIFRSLVETTKK